MEGQKVWGPIDLLILLFVWLRSILDEAQVRSHVSHRLCVYLASICTIYLTSVKRPVCRCFRSAWLAWVAVVLAIELSAVEITSTGSILAFCSA